MNIKPFALLLLATLGVANAGAQQVLSLDSCRAMALRNNKKLNITKFKQEMAMNTRKAARTKYLPHVDVVGGYTFTSREISLLNKQQKAAFNGLGSNLVSGLSSNLTPTPSPDWWSRDSSPPSRRDSSARCSASSVRIWLSLSTRRARR